MTQLKIIYPEDRETFDENKIGGKAKNLLKMYEHGLAIPKFLILTQVTNPEYDVALTIDNLDGIYDFKDSLSVKIKFYFGDDYRLAVRSSAIAEDGMDNSFAGMFETKLNVVDELLEEAILDVMKSASSQRVKKYCEQQQSKKEIGLSIILQEMIEADLSGVAFGANPVTGKYNEKLINAVYGLGEGLVSGDLEADQYQLIENRIQKRIAQKRYAYRYDLKSGKGLIKTPLAEQLQFSSVLEDHHIVEIKQLLEKCESIFHTPQDVEFAYKDKKLYVLQSRPITALPINASKEFPIVWDNSNIVESYPGVTTPLTFSFISKSYENAYKLFVRYLGVNKSIIRENESVFQNTLGLINGRVYYNLKSWYHMLAMLPGYSVNARYMEKMMGVKETFELPEELLLSKSQAWYKTLRSIIHLMFRFWDLPRKRRNFQNLLDATIKSYKSIDFSKKSDVELMNLFRQFEQNLLFEWKAPLLNDFFAMIWFGLLEKRIKKHINSSNVNLHNDLLCQSSDIVSVEPIYRTMELSAFISNTKSVKELFVNNSEHCIWNEINHHPEHQVLKEKINRYLNDFGERCVGELKLETSSYNQEPLLYIRILKSYVQNEVHSNKLHNSVESKIRIEAEREVKNKLKNKPLRKILLLKTLRKTRELVSARENLRYERTRAFGIVREIFSSVGNNWYNRKIIDHPRDIFYLTIEEIFAFIEGRSVQINIVEHIALRKKEFQSYQENSTTAERIRTYGTVYVENNFFQPYNSQPLQGDLKGIGCCPGRVKARARVISDPTKTSDLKGDILVTSSTDPGWVVLFPTASAIIVERGSLLSHSAIVSREMGIPCIVGVTDLLKKVKNGTWLEIDGNSGEIKILKD